MSIPYADILIIALIAGFILLRLRSILGQDVGFDGRGGDDSFRANDATPSGSKEEPKILQINPKEFARKLEQELKGEEEAKAPDQEQLDKLEEAQRETVAEIKKIEATFDLNRFLEGAKGAFEMVLKAFQDNDAETLKHLLADDIEEMFVEEAKARQEGDTKMDTTLVSIAEAKITDVELRQKHASISVQFISEQVSVERDKDGEIVGGDVSHIDRIEDEWTFERDLGAKHPNWIITAT